MVTILHFLVLLVIVVCKRSVRKSLKKAFFPIINKFHHYLQATVFIFAVAFSVLTIANTASNKCCVTGTWHLGLFTIILGWTYLIHLSSTLPFIGEQAIVFLDIVKTFLKLTLFALLLVLAATIILSMTFYNAEAMVCYRNIKI